MHERSRSSESGRQRAVAGERHGPAAAQPPVPTEPAVPSRARLTEELSTLVRFEPDGAPLFARYRDFAPAEEERFRAWSGALSDRELADEVARRRAENEEKSRDFWARRPGRSRITRS